MYNQQVTSQKLSILGVLLQPLNLVMRVYQALLNDFRVLI